MVGRDDVRLEVERLIHAPKREMGLVGVWGGGGVMGFEFRGPMYGRDGGARVSPEGGMGSDLDPAGAEKADPISESVSTRTFMRMDGARQGTWCEGDGGGRLIKAGDCVWERYALARRSSTMVLSSRIASSTSVLARRKLPGREGAVFERLRDGEGRRERTRAGENVPEVRERRIVGRSSKGSVASSNKKGRVGVAIVASVVPDNLRSCILMVVL